MKKLATFVVAGFLAFAGMPYGGSHFGVPTVEAVGTGTTILEGSDATGFHHDSTYTSQLFFFMRTDSYNSALPVLVWNDNGTVDLNASGAPASTVYVTSLAAIPTLVGVYSAIYIQSPTGCCAENPVTDASEIAKINALRAAGGSISIQDYQGGNSAILGFSVAGSAIGGFGGPAGGPTCFDTEIFLANALAAGFTQPGSLGCWGHQAYDNAVFGPLGFTTLVDSGRPFDSLGSGSWSSFLAKGGTLGTRPTPEPASIVLLGFGLAGIARFRRKQK